MTTDELTYYHATLVSRFARLWRLRRELSDELNATGHRMLDNAVNAAYVDCVAAGVRASSLDTYISSAPPPPAEPSPEGRS